MSTNRAIARTESQSPAVVNQNNSEVAGVLAVIERAALNPDINIEKMQALLEMQERILKQRAEVSFNSSFAEMQSEIPSITERGKIIHSGRLISQYALFEDINDQVKPILQKHGFAITFRTHTEKDSITVTGILMHRDGHREQTDMTLASDTSGAKTGVQAIGSSVSYAKRYVLCALLNITTRGEDDDGVKGNLHPITDDQVATLTALAEEVKADLKQFCKYMKVNSLSEIPANSYESAVKALERKRAGK